MSPSLELSVVSVLDATLLEVASRLLLTSVFDTEDITKEGPEEEVVIVVVEEGIDGVVVLDFKVAAEGVVVVGVADFN